MIAWDDKLQSLLKKTRLAAIGLLYLPPAAFLLVAAMLKIPKRSGGEYQFLFYILFIIALVQPTLVPLIERMQINSYKKYQSQMNPRQLFFSLSIIKFAFVESIYMYALVIFILSGDLSSMLYFYPVGIIWSIVYWPRRSTVEKYLQRTQMHGPIAN